MESIVVLLMFSGLCVPSISANDVVIRPGVVIEASRQQFPTQEAEHDSSRTGGTRPLTPEESLNVMRVSDGYRVELVAAEPLVVDPVAIDFGPDGKLWVAEMRDYPEGVPGKEGAGGVVKFLEDTDGDGRYDRSTLFLENVAFPTGVTAWRNGVLICSAPDIIYAEDTNQDGIADIRKVVLSGFATHNYQARVNSLSLGLDNWTYGASGIFGGKLTAEGHPAVNVQNRDFRFHPDEGVVEAVTGRTQQGRARDDWGNWFGCVNDVLLTHYPSTARYFARRSRVPVPPSVIPIVSDPQLYPSGELVQFQKSGASGLPTSVCGLAIYRDTLLGNDYSNNAFVCEPVNQLVHRRILKPNGSTFTAIRAAGDEKSEFFTSTDNWFRPVQVRTGPDGALYLVDMYRYVIEHPKFISDDVKSRLDIRAGDTRGRIYRVVPTGSKAREVPKVRKSSSAELVTLLDSPNGTLRDMVHIELLWRQDQDADDALKTLALNGSTPQGRLHALCVLDGLKRLTPELISQVLKQEKHPGVLRNAIRVSEPFLKSNPELVEELVQLADQSDSQVQLQLAYSLGIAESPSAVPALAKLLMASEKDQQLLSAVLAAMTETQLKPLFVELEKMQCSGSQVYPAVILAAQMGDVGTVHSEVSKLIGHSSPVDLEARLSMLATVRSELNRRKVQLDPEQQKVWDQAFSSCRELSADGSASVGVRVAAIRCLNLMTDPDEAISSLEECLQPQQPPAVQEAAIQAIAMMKGMAGIEVLFDVLRGMAPTIQSTAMKEICSREDLTIELLDRIEKQALPRTLIDSTRKQQLIEHRNALIRTRALSLFDQPTNQEIASHIASVRAADFSGGNRDAGEKVFVKHCATCHLFEGLGKAVGPDLSSLSDRSKDFLVTAIFDPNSAIDRRYATYSAALNDGRIVAGVLASESDHSLLLKEKDGVQIEILRSEIEELRDTGKSLMPEGLGREMTSEELKDLLAFLKATKLEAAPSSSTSMRTMEIESVRKIAELMQGVKIGTRDEYRVIPQVFRLSIAAGKRNQPEEIRAVLDYTLPQIEAPLRDWEAVVIGGGIINGISQQAVWPADRINELLSGHEILQARWVRTLTLAEVMAHDETVEPGTRYDALRIVAMSPFHKSRKHLEKYLAPGTNGDLLQGAVSGLADVPNEDAAVLLVTCYPQLPSHIRQFALEGLVRPHGEQVYLLNAIVNKKLNAQQVPKAVVDRLLKHKNPSVKAKSMKFFASHVD